MTFCEDGIVTEITSAYLDKAGEIAIDRIKAAGNPHYTADFDEVFLPYRDFNKVDFSHLEKSDITSALQSAKDELPEIFETRINSNILHNIPTYQWKLEKKYNYHCTCESLDCHLEAEQSLHWYSGARQNLCNLDDDLLTWLIFKARDYAFYRGIKKLKAFFENNESICDCRDRTKLNFWTAATYIAMHSGKKAVRLHEHFVERIKQDIVEDPTISYFWAMFEDFRSNHGLVVRGQIIGSFVILEDGEAVFSPPIEDIALANKLRVKFGRPSVEEYRKGCEQHLKAGTLPWEDWR